MKTMLTRLLAKPDRDIRQIVSSVDASAAPRGLRRRLEKIRNKKQGGFTLLELLVVVAILATIAATATIMLEDTDRKASAAAHVTIMDELIKGVATYRVLHQGQMPDNWDSLLTNTAATLAAATVPSASNTDFGLDSGLSGMLGTVSIDNATAGGLAIVTALNGVGIGGVQVLHAGAGDPNGTAPGNCASLADMRTMINDKSSDVTNSSMFSTFKAYSATDSNRAGCGATVTFDKTTANVGAVLARLNAAENYRIGAATTDIVVALGFGGSNDLFKRENLGSLTGAPFYRHVDGSTYNRFVGLFNTGAAATPLTEARFMSVIDGSGDTKEEELAEWDNTRSTL